MYDNKRTLVRIIPAPGCVYDTNCLRDKIKDALPEDQKEWVTSKGHIEVYVRLAEDMTVVPIYRWVSYIQTDLIPPQVMEVIEHPSLWELREIIMECNPKTRPSCWYQ